MSDEEALVVAALLRLGAARSRSLAMDAAGPLRDWIEAGTSAQLTQAKHAASQVLEQLVTAGARIVSLSSPQYPAALRDLPDPPAFLCVRGSAPAPGGVAVIGSRTPTPAGASIAEEFARGLTEPLVSGLALGVDGAAHRGALAAGVVQVVYVGHGFGATYPPEHRGLENAIVAAGGSVATERLPGQPATRWTLVRRDRLQAAHGGASVVVESELGGGAMQTMRFATALGRRRYAFAPRADEPLTRGNAYAIRCGAVPLPWDAEAAWALVRKGSADASR